MQDGLNVDRERDDGLGAGDATNEQFLDAQYRKTALRDRYRDGGVAESVGHLLLAMEQDVIPRLVAARTGASLPTATGGHAAATIDGARVHRFARLLVGHDTDVLPSTFVETIRRRGATIESIHLDLLAPAARRVGIMWDEDICTFFDVTVALGTLHRIMLSLSDDFRPDFLMLDPARHILLIQQTGAAHTFGLSMVAEFFRRGAWSVDVAAALSRTALRDAVQAQWFTVVGFSAAVDADIDTLADAIALVRRSSRNPAVGLLVGGPAVVADPTLVARVGADGMAIDAVRAVVEAERFVLRAA